MNNYPFDTTTIILALGLLVSAVLWTGMLLDLIARKYIKSTERPTPL